MKNRLITIIALFSLVFAGGCGMLNGYALYIGPEAVSSSGESEISGEAPESVLEEGTDSQPVVSSNLIWVAPEGDDSNSGSIGSPYQTIGRAVAAAITASGSKEIRIAAGDYQEVVSIGDGSSYHGLKILGGYGAYSASSLTRNRDPVANLTKLKRLVIDGSSSAPLNDEDSFIEGMVLSALVVKNASPTISSSIISQSEASGTCQAVAAVVIESSAANNATPVFSGNRIENVDCSYDGSSAIYVAVEVRSLDQSTLSPRFENNEIVAGFEAAVPADVALGFVAHSAKYSKVEPTLNGNMIATDSSLFYASAVNMWADSPDSTANLNMTGNEVRAGQATLSNGVDLGYDSIHDAPAFYNLAKIERNKIASGNESSLATALSIYNSNEVSSIVNNFISAGKSQDPWAWLSGIYLENADADIINNTIFADSADIATLVNLLSASGSTNIVNNIIAAAGAGTYFAGIVELMPGSQPAAVMANLFDSAINTIYSSADWGDMFTVEELALFYPAFDPNYFGDALLVDPVNMDLHISAGSAAVDMAEQAFAPAADFDGAARPLGAGIDIGADELM